MDRAAHLRAQQPALNTNTDPSNTRPSAIGPSPGIERMDSAGIFNSQAHGQSSLPVPGNKEYGDKRGSTYSERSVYSQGKILRRANE